MADNEGSAEKTEEATPKRRQDAKEEGRIVTSKEVFVAASMVVMLAGIALLPGMLQSLAAGWARGLVLPGRDGLDQAVALGLNSALANLAMSVALVGAPVILLILLLQGAVGGINFAPNAVHPKLSKLNPVAGLQRMISVQAGVELLKALIKVVALAAAAWMVTSSRLGDLMTLGDMTPREASALMLAVIYRMVFSLVLVLTAIGGLDAGWQMLSLNKSLRMTKQESKEEAKESNGSPEVKGRMRRLQIEASRKGAKQRAALDDVPKATTVVTNPTHFAVALRFVPGEDEAPVVLAMGKGVMATQIIARARKAHVQIVGAPPLARALYFTGDIGRMIDDRLYVAVAAVLAHVYRLERGEPTEMPDIDLPPDMRFTPEGRVG